MYKNFRELTAAEVELISGGDGPDIVVTAPRGGGSFGGFGSFGFGGSGWGGFGGYDTGGYSDGGSDAPAVEPTPDDTTDIVVVGVKPPLEQFDDNTFIRVYNGGFVEVYRLQDRDNFLGHFLGAHDFYLDYQGIASLSNSSNPASVSVGVPPSISITLPTTSRTLTFLDNQSDYPGDDIRLGPWRP